MAEFSGESVDLTKFPAVTFGEVEAHGNKLSGCDTTTKAYKYFAEPGYFHSTKVCYSQVKAKLTSKCYRSMKKTEPPHTLQVIVDLASKSVKGSCSCACGDGGLCHHVLGLLFYVAHCKTLRYLAIPDDLTCTSMPQRWSVPRGRKISNKIIQDVHVKKPRQGADYSKFIKSTLYSPVTEYPIILQEHLVGLDPVPLIATIAVKGIQIPTLPMEESKFGKVAKGSVLSYQQNLSKKYVLTTT